MTTFRYTAMDGSGRERRGELMAEDESQANTLLRERGLFPTSVQVSKGTAKKAGKQAKKKTKRKYGSTRIVIGRPRMKRK